MDFLLSLSVKLRVDGKCCELFLILTTLIHDAALRFLIGSALIVELSVSLVAHVAAGLESLNLLSNTCYRIGVRLILVETRLNLPSSSVFFARFGTTTLA